MPTLFYIIIFFFFFHFVIIVHGKSPFIPPDLILLNCGSFSLTTSRDGRKWAGDIGSKFGPSAALDNTSMTSKPLYQLPSVPQVPYMTSRIFLSQFTYTFPLSPGPKFLRLYFYPASYPGLDVSKALFSVASSGYTLLTNFTPYLSAYALTQAYFTREFSITIGNKKRLKLTFIPSSTISGSYAFVNGIEVVSMPRDFYIRGEDSPVTLVGHPFPFFIQDTTALETFYRLNVGGNNILPGDDTGMFRVWADDSNYLPPSAKGVSFAVSNVDIKFPPTIPAYTAPASVYSTARSMGPHQYQTANANYDLTWILPIDPGFYYLVRLHFCEIESVVKLRNQRLFNIFINNQTAEYEADVIGWSGGTEVAVYRDYVVMVSKGTEGNQDLWVALHPSNQSEYYDVILNGMEIFKLTNRDNVIAVPVPPQPAPIPAPAKWTPDRTMIIIFDVCAVSGLLIFFLSGYIVYRSCRREKWCSLLNAMTRYVHLGSKKTNAGTRHFSFGEIRAATDNFAKNRIIGFGGFGNVYKGYIDSGLTIVAIKRRNPASRQGVHEFQTEIEMLSKLRHLHLVSLIGYCEEDGEMILVYDYMAHGTLRDHLYNKTQKPPLSWNQRLRICIGAARGLHYLHTGAKQPIIHRDVKTTNILLDEKWVAKISDFGLSKVGPNTVSHTHVSTVVKGSFGYMDPEYIRRQKLTKESDVYSFGVVLFEVLCARPANDAMVSLVELVRRNIGEGTLYQIIDPSLSGQFARESLTTFTEIAEKCLADRRRERPSMGMVLCNLELSLSLQERADHASEGMVGMSHSQITDFSSAMTDAGQMLGSHNSDVTPL